MKGVLVTGATTPFGRALVQGLLDDDDFGHVIALGADEHPDLPLNGRLTWIRADLTRSRSIRRLLFGPVREHRIEAIVHGAHHRNPADRGRKLHRLNVESTRLMLRLAEQHPTVRHFILRSYADVYRVRPHLADILWEDAPLELGTRAPQILRDRVEADVTACGRLGLSSLRILVLRCAEIYAAEMGSQLWDYLHRRACVRPVGFDPMVNLLSLDDAVQAHLLALKSKARGVVNIPGKDTLPLTRAIRLSGKQQFAVPGWMLGPAYRLRRGGSDAAFRYHLNVERFHSTAILGGQRAGEVLGYEPKHPLAWTTPTN